MSVTIHMNANKLNNSEWITNNLRKLAITCRLLIDYRLLVFLFQYNQYLIVLLNFVMYSNYTIYNY